MTEPSRSRSASSTPVLKNVQALRAVAVLVVVVYHLWPHRLSGGYVGVDVFFVISGYLITAHLMREVAKHGRISLATFYARRARRLLPAALAVIVATAVGMVLWMPISRWDESLREFIASALYFENWALVAKATNYLQMDSDPSPMQHYWSLSVEEQFYLAWPLLIIVALVLATKASIGLKRVATVLLGATVVASLAYGIWITFAEPQLAYFSTFARAWQFGAGGLLALMPLRRELPVWLSSSLGWTGLATIVLCSFLYDDSTAFPGYAAIPVVLAALAVIVGGNPGSRAAPTWLYRLRPVQYVGGISYATYLWHWPLIVIAPFVLETDLDFVTKLALLGGTLLLADFTRRWIEDPIRRNTWLQAGRAGRSLVPLVAAMAVVAIASLGGSVALEREIDRQLRIEQEATDDVEIPLEVEASVAPESDAPLLPSPLTAADDVERNPECWSPETTSRLAKCSYPSAHPEALRVALVGDSHAEQFSGAMIAIAEEAGWHLETYFKQACTWGGGPMVKPGSDFAAKCTSYRVALNQALLRANYDVIVTANAAYRVEPQNSARDYVSTWSPIVEAGAKLIVIADNPQWQDDPVECLMIEDDPADCSISRDEAYPWPDPQIEAAVMIGGVAVVDLSSRYCDDSVCPAVIDRTVVYRNNDHFTRTFARSLAPYLRDAFEDLGMQVQPSS